MLMDSGRTATLIDRLGQTLVRRRHIALALFIAVMALGSAGLTRVRVDTGWDAWILEDSPLVADDAQFRDLFGNNDYVGVLVSADNIFTQPTLTLIRELGQELKASTPFADSVFSVTDCELAFGDAQGIHVVNPVPAPVPADAAVLEGIRNEFMRNSLTAGRLVSHKADQAWIVLRLRPFPAGWRNAEGQDAGMAVGQAAAAVIGQERYAPLRPRAAGMPVIAHDKTAFFTAELQRMLGLSLLVTLCIAAMTLRSLCGLCIAVLATSGSCILSFGIQGWLGRAVDMGMVMVPVYLGIAVSLSYSIHIIAMFRRQFLATGDRHAAVLHAFRQTCLPVFFTALTTICAFCTFFFVNVKPVRWTGFAASLQVGVIFFVVMFMAPILLSFGRDRKPKGEEAARGRSVTRLERGMASFANAVLAHPRGIFVALLLFVAFCGAGLFRFQINFDIRETMGDKVPYVQRLLEISQSELGALYSYDLVVEFPDDGMALEPENLGRLEVLEGAASGFALTRQVSSILEIIKNMHQVLRQGDPAFHTIPESKGMVAQILLLYASSGGAEPEKWIDYENRRLRLLVDLKDYNTRGANEEMFVLIRQARELFPDAQVALAGSIARMTILQDVVARGQVLSVFLALCIISLLLALLFSSLKVGFIAMIPNIAPMLVVGGSMGWAGVPLDMMTITVMPMILGLAVDDTIHFVCHAQRAFARTGSYREAVRRTFCGVGVPLLFTSLILAASFLVYATSPARVYVYTGLTVGAGIMAALLADYCVTPILLQRTRAFGQEK